MATVKTARLAGDSGSQELAQLLISYNALVDLVGTFFTTVKSATLVSDIVTAVTTAETSIQALNKVAARPALPVAPIVTPIK